MNRSDFDSLAQFAGRSNPFDAGETTAIVDQIFALRDRIAPQGDTSGTLDAAALLMRYRTSLTDEIPARVTETVCKLLSTAADHYTGEAKTPQVPATRPEPRAPIPSELEETNLRLVSDLFIGELLVRDGSISKDELEKALEFQKVSGDRLGQTLINMGALSWDVIENALREQGRRSA